MVDIFHEITNSEVDSYIDSVSEDKKFYKTMKWFFRDEILDYLDSRDKATQEGLV